MTVDTIETNFYLRIRGVWVPIPDVETDIKKVSKRARSDFESAGGNRFEWLAAKGNAVWDVEYADEDATAFRLLTYAASGKAGPVWLYDVQAAQVNMLGENNTQGGSATLVVVDGIPMPAFLQYEYVDVKIRGGLTYHLSYTTTAVEGTEVGAYTATDWAIQRFYAPSGTGPRRCSTAFRFDDDQDVRIGWTTGGVTSGARLTEGSVDDSGWMPGESTPCRVVVADREQVLRSVFANELGRSDAAFQIRQVG